VDPQGNLNSIVTLGGHVRKRILAVALAASIFTGAGLSIAAAAPGPNGKNDHGICTAYFNGQKKGHGGDDDRQPPPFQALEDTSREYTDNDGADNDRDGEVDEEGENESLSDAENIFNFCNDTTVIGGNPEHGRFTCSDPGASSDPECTDNEEPGKSDDE
jgi:hypothetical protein